MKKCILSICLLVLEIFTLKCAALDKEVTLLLSNPSYELVQDMLCLIRQKKIEVPNLRIIGIYHEQEEERFEKAMQFVKEQKLEWISFFKIVGSVAPKDLFGKNEWTETFHKLFCISDGILFPGGPDIPPCVYGEKTNLLTVIVTPHRHHYEASFLFHLLGGSQNKEFDAFLNSKPSYLVWGICLGMQTMNVATGGTLYQDIPSEVYGLKYAEEVLSQPQEEQHKNYNVFLTNDKNLSYAGLHSILIKNEGPFSAQSAQFPLVLTAHHQCARNLGLDIKVWATSRDEKIVEGIYHARFPNVIAFQFHPEKDKLWDPSISLKKNKNDAQTIADIFLGSAPSVSFHELIWKTFATQLQAKK